jgi:hypothetical protein
MSTIVGKLFTVRAEAVRHCRTCKGDFVFAPAPVTGVKDEIGNKIDKAVKAEMTRKGWRLGNCPKCVKRGGKGE